MDKISQLQVIDQAFLPAREIEIPELFSGRKEEVVQGLHALRSQGASLCIYGRRGVGKSSVAKQLRLVAAGYPTLTDLIGYPELFDMQLFRMPSVYFYCDDTIKDANDLFRKLLSDRDSLDGIARYNDGVILRRTKEKQSRTARLTFKLLETSEKDETETENIVAEIDPVAAFKSVTSEIVDAAASEGIVVVIDEFERIGSKVGIASVIKTCPRVKFIIVGVSDDLRSLISDHESVYRHLAEGTIKINPMTNEMLIEILKRAEALLKEITFEDSVIARIAAMSDGYPHWIHLLGRASCIDAVEHDEVTVWMENLMRALGRLVKNEPFHEDLYMQTTKGDINNEFMLKTISRETQDNFNPENVYNAVKSRSISYTIFQEFIATLISSSILIPIENRFTSFKDIRFKVYSKIRPPLYPENELRNITDDWSNALFTVSNFTLSSRLTDYLYTNYISDFYTKASDFVGFSDWTPLFTEEKPLLYDSKGNPIKTEKVIKWHSTKDRERR
jgi:hypothetical protein